MRDAEIWTVIGLGATYGAWLLNQVRVLGNRVDSSLSETRAEMARGFGDIRGEMATLRSELREDLRDLRADLRGHIRDGH